MILTTARNHTTTLMWSTVSEAVTPMFPVLYGYLKHKDCRKALEYGNAMAALKHSVIGDMITTDLEEIDSIIAEHKNTGYHSEMNR